MKRRFAGLAAIAAATALTLGGCSSDNGRGSDSTAASTDGAAVTKKVETNTIIGGNPAKIINEGVFSLTILSEDNFDNTLPY